MSEYGYLSEHLSCPNLNNPDNTGFSFHHADQDTRHTDVVIEVPTIIFMLEGELEFSYGRHYRKRLSAGQFLLVPAGTMANVDIVRESRSIRCRLDMPMQLCQYFRLDQLEPVARASEGELHPLEMDEYIRPYIQTVEAYINDGVMCSCLGKHKHQELIFILRAKYTRDELARFFAPIINKDIYFMDAVRRNYRVPMTVAEFADKLHYSVSGFNKRFERSFGQSARSWMQQQRAEYILRDLRENRLSNKEIAHRYGFSSSARFYEFCHSMWGTPPGEIRKGIPGRKQG